ncbi:MAG: hypothetical protein AAGJ79_02625 [Verrucomicrobiota bacterium]
MDSGKTGPDAEFPESLKFHVRELTLSLSADRLGFDPHKVPDDLETSLAGSLIKSKFNDSGATVMLGDVVDGCPERYRPAFSRSDRATPVEIPVEKIRPQLLESPKKAEPANLNGKSGESEGAEDFNPFAMLDDNSPSSNGGAPAENGKKDEAAASASSPFAQLPKLGASPVAMPEIPKAEEATQEAPAASTGSLFGDANAPDEPAPANVGASPFSSLASAADEPKKKEDSSPASPPLGQSPWGAATGMTPAAKSTPEPLESLSLGATSDKSEKASPGETTVPGGFSGTTFPGEEDGQSVLRALFMTSEELDTAKVIEFCSQLPGIEGCALLSKDGSVAASSKASGDFKTQAKDTHESLKKMVDALGMGDADIFTLRSNKAMLSFFQANGACVAVQHEKTGFQPGVQEKLGLVAKELDALTP